MTHVTDLKLNIASATIQRDGEDFVIRTGATPELEEVVKPKGFEMWKPNEGQSYWYVDGTCSIIETTFDETDTRMGAAWIHSLTAMPTWEMARIQAQILGITLKLNQAAVMYGGRVGGPMPLEYSVRAEPDASHPVAPWALPDAIRRDAFCEAFRTDLTRLAELNAQLTREWQTYLSK